MPLLLIPHIHRTTHQIGLYIGRSGLGVSQGEAHILAHLAEVGDCSIADLHKAFAHKRSTLTSVLDRLSDRNLIRREVSAKDRRSFTVRLTPTGKKLARRVYRLLVELERAALNRIEGAVECRTVLEAIDRVCVGSRRAGTD